MYVSSPVRREWMDILSFTEKGFQDLSPLDESRIERTPYTFASAASKVGDIRRRYDEPFRIAVVGDFKAGKSAFLNAILGGKDIVIEGVTPTTGAVTELWWSEEEGGEVIVGHDDKVETIYVGSLADVSKYSDQRTEQGRSISGKGARVVLRLNLSLLNPHDQGLARPRA
ncbi:dynamin family protein [Desulfatirhabdium butyrativorans]|uniref:dynamin family protein n=1 Tax=Desulfatirhabdium butyrativorans TaxID=340467 RepID=UPI0004841726|nr:dynamin family protein [Desulfatirhabdium butyrativorans]